MIAEIAGRAKRALLGLSIPAYLAGMAIMTAVFIVLTRGEIIPALVGRLLMVPVALGALHYPPRRAYFGGWLIVAAALTWQTLDAEPQTSVSARDAIVLDLVALSFGELLYRFARGRAAASARLATSERFFRAVLENATEVIWVINADATLRYASPAAQSLFSIGNGPLGSGGIESIVPEDRPRAMEHLAEALRRPNDVIGDFNLSVNNGLSEVITLSLSVCNLLNDPAVRGIVVNGRNVTEVVRAEEALRGSEANYQRLYLVAVENARELAAIDQVRSAVARVHTLQELASAAARAVSVALSQAPTAVAVTDDAAGVACEVSNDNAELRAAIVQPARVIETAREQPALTFDANGYGRVSVPLRDGERVAGALVVIGTPKLQITQSEADLVAALGSRIDSALTRLRLYQAIARERDFLVAVMETTNQPISVGPPGGRFQYTNPAYQRITGRSREELLSMTVADLVLPEDWPMMLARRLAAGRGTETLAYENRMVRADGVIIPVLVSLTLQPHAPPPGLIVAVLTDLTEIKRTEEALRETNRALEVARDEAIAASKLKSDFLATLSHEIRTPMNGILGMAELLLDTPLGPNQREYAGDILQSGSALMDIINRILDFSRLEAGTMKLELTTVPIREVLGQVIELMSATAQAKGIKLSCVIDPETPETLLADPVRLRQVLINLVGNAVKFTASGSVDVRAFRSSPVRVRFEIADTGIGISPQFHDRLFLPFSQGESSHARRYGGTGLGLAVSKSLIELMGGDIGAHANDAKGTTFWFELPG